MSIGAEVEAVFEDHDDVDPPFTLVQWRVARLPGRGPILERGEEGPGRVAPR